MSVELVSDLREVSIADCWDSYYQMNNQILPGLPPPVFAQIYHQAQPTVISIGIGSELRKVSISDFWDSYYCPNPRPISHPQPTVLSGGIVSDLREVSIADCWDSYYRPTDQILPDLPSPDFAQNYHQAKTTILSVVIGSDVTKVSVSDCRESYYRTNPHYIFHPLFLRGIIIRQNPKLRPLQ